MKKLAIVIDERLEHGFAIIKKVQQDGSTPEYTLARLMFNEGGGISQWQEFLSSKFKFKLMKEYEKQLKTNKKIIMNVEETIKNLTVPQLKSLLPSYYQLVIERRIAELESNANTKVKRGRKKSVKNSD